MKGYYLVKNKNWQKMADTSFKNLPFYAETEFVNLLPNLQKKTEISKKNQLLDLQYYLYLKDKEAVFSWFWTPKQIYFKTIKAFS